MPKPTTLPEFVVTENGCWQWHLATNRSGYGKYGGRTMSRVILAVKLGRPLPPTAVACHTCDNPTCINPDHLFQGTQPENIQDCINKERAWFQKGLPDNCTTCGQPYSFDKRGYRVCRVCHAKRARERYREDREAGLSSREAGRMSRQRAAAVAAVRDQGEA